MDRKMGAEQNHDPSSTPKLSLFSFPSKTQEPPGMLTPPIQTLASVPFQWEEAPGKPRPSCARASNVDHDSKPKSARCLELPPRLLTESKAASIPSPTAVLDGPYVGRAQGNTLSSFRKGRSFRIPAAVKEISKEKALFGSSRWGIVRKNKEVVVDGGFDFLFSDVHGGLDGGGNDDPKAKISRIKKRSGSFLSLSQTKSQNLLTSIYESFKQAVPWSRRRQDKLRESRSRSSSY